MMSSDEIQKKQNSEHFLKVQYAARCYYNSAEKLNYCVWLFCLVSAFSIFLPTNLPEIVIRGIPFVADLIALIILGLTHRKVKTAASLRKYFDAFVLDICVDQFTENERRDIKEITWKAYSKDSAEAEIQITNTGKDLPPGVNEWYVFLEPCTGISAKFECQRQNAWWNSKMSHMRLAVTMCVAALVGIMFLLLVVNGNTLAAILCSAGLIAKILERVTENVKYIKVSIQIDGAMRTIERHPTEEGIETLQKFIDERRAIVVLEPNFFHKKSAKTLSKVYEERIL